MTAHSKLPNSDLQLVSPTKPSHSNHQLVCNSDTFDWRKMESLKFLVQISLSAIVLTTCLWQLPRVEGSDKAIYWGGISSILAWWTPSPADKGMNKKEE